MRVETLDRFPDELDKLATRLPQASFYQTTGWLESLGATFPDWAARCIVARDGDDVIGYLPYFVIRRSAVRLHWSLPFGSYGGPVAIDDRSAEILVQRYLETRRERGVHEVGIVDFPGRFDHSTLTSQTSTTHLIDLQAGFEAIWNRFDKSKRRQTRRAEREGVVVSRAETTAEVEQYYSIYRERSEEWKQRIRYPKALFENLLIHGGENVRLFVARADDRVIGGHLNFYFADSVIAWNGVTAANEHGKQASTMLYSFCLRHACEAGYKTYNLGGSLGKDTLVDFKRSLGGAPYSYEVRCWRSLFGRVASAMRRHSRIN